MLNTLFIRESLERMGVTTPTIHVWRAPRMRLHRNAKTTPLMRQLIVDRATGQHWTQARAAEAAGVSVRTVAKWVARWRAGDRACRCRIAAPPTAPARGRGDRPPHRAASTDARDRMADQYGAAGAALDRHPRLAPGRPESAEGARGPGPSSAAMSGRTPATCCTWTSNPWAGSGASATV